MALGIASDILFDARIDDSGSHRVFYARHERIEFTAIQNLYHELAHAMHMMSGTWRYFASKNQAIEEENVFRCQLADIRGQNPSQRYQKAGVFIADDHRDLLFDGNLAARLPT